MIKLFLVDDDSDFIQRLLDPGFDEYRILGSERLGNNVFEQLKKNNVDIVLLNTDFIPSINTG